MHRSLCDKREGENKREKIHDRNSTKVALRSHQSGLLRFSVKEENMMLKLITGSGRTLLYRRFYDNQKVKVSDSATKKIGLPPVEIATAWANVAFAPSEAAHVCKASIVGK